MSNNTGTVVRKEQCPSCAEQGFDRSKNNQIVYDNGTWCFRCDKGTFLDSSKVPMISVKEPIIGTYHALESRKISKSVCEKYRVQQKDSKIIYNFFDNGVLVDQKVRDLTDKNVQFWTQGSRTSRLFGMDCQNPNKKVPVIITEGEYDAMCVFQETGLPAVSITKGCKGAAKQIMEHLEWLQGWKDVVLMFDNDAGGNEAVADIGKIAAVPGLFKACRLPLKDANDMVLAGRGGELSNYIWNASPIKKTSVVCLHDIRNEVLTPPTMGTPWPWKTMTQITFGMRVPELLLIVAAEGIGKTEFIKEILKGQIQNKNNIGLFSLEQSTADTGQRLVGGLLNKQLQVPGSKDWNTKAIEAKLDEFDRQVFLYDSQSGVLSLDKLLINIPYLHKCHKVNFFVIDNLTAMCAHPYIDGKRMSESNYAGVVMAKLAELTRLLDINIIMVAHTNKDQISKQQYVSSSPKNLDAVLQSSAQELDKLLNPPGSTWESGRVPNTSHILGSGNAARLADHVIALSRNKMSDDPVERSTTYVKFIKTGRRNPACAVKEFKVRYDYDTGSLIEVVGV